MGGVQPRLAHPSIDSADRIGAELAGPQSLSDRKGAFFSKLLGQLQVQLTKYR